MAPRVPVHALSREDVGMSETHLCTCCRRWLPLKAGPGGRYCVDCYHEAVGE